MKKKILFIMLFVSLVALVFTSCQSGGVSQADYDQLNAQLVGVQSQLAQSQSEIASLNSQVEADRAAIQAKDDKLAYYESRVADLQTQLAALQVQYDLTGATPAETAQKIVAYYHETHVYSSYDLFVCSDMASEVWNMLKAVGISSVIAVGNVDSAISDILDSNHAWVLAEVVPGQYLALETTGGFAVTETENPLYYVGWSFAGPADLKSNNDLRKEYNIRVGFRNLLASEYNSSTDPAVRDVLNRLRLDQEAILNSIMAQINGLASVL